MGQGLLVSVLELAKPWPLKLVVDHVLGGRPLSGTPLDGWSAAALLSLLVSVSLVWIAKGFPLLPLSLAP